jgi:O-antigen/teichoic acid export membrane protein
LFKEGDYEQIAKLAQSTSIILLFIVSIPSVILLLFPSWVLSWFGSDYTVGATALMILVVGQFINVACGSVGYLLTMTGKEKVMRNIMLVTALVNVGLSIYLVQDFGMKGVAFATAFSIVLWNIWAMILSVETIHAIMPTRCVETISTNTATAIFCCPSNPRSWFWWRIS